MIECTVYPQFLFRTIKTDLFTMLYIYFWFCLNPDVMYEYLSCGQLEDTFSAWAPDQYPFISGSPGFLFTSVVSCYIVLVNLCKSKCFVRFPDPYFVFESCIICSSFYPYHYISGLNIEVICKKNGEKKYIYSLIIMMLWLLQTVIENTHELALF